MFLSDQAPHPPFGHLLPDRRRKHPSFEFTVMRYVAYAPLLSGRGVGGEGLSREGLGIRCLVGEGWPEIKSINKKYQVIKKADPLICCVFLTSVTPCRRLRELEFVLGENLVDTGHAVPLEFVVDALALTANLLDDLTLNLGYLAPSQVGLVFLDPIDQGEDGVIAGDLDPNVGLDLSAT
jgi:hypothetical protein